MMHKRGLSTVISVMILVMLVVSLVAIVWGVVSNLVTKNIANSESCFGNFDKIEIEGKYTYFDPSTNELQFSISLKDVDVDKVIVLISGISGTKTYTLTNDEQTISGLMTYPSIATVKLPEKNAGLTYIASGFSEKPDSIRISPVINGQQCEVSNVLSEIETRPASSGACTQTCNTSSEPNCQTSVPSNSQNGAGVCCGAGESCYQCQAGYSWNGTDCNLVGCTDTCASLGYNCGTQTVCGVSTDCGGVCSSPAVCSSGICVLQGQTMLYVSTATHNGNFGGRSGADSFCVSHTPSSLILCNNIHAFLSVTSTDEIRDMPLVYGYNPSQPLYWYNSATGVYTKLADNWTDAFDGDIYASAVEGTGLPLSSDYWTGSYVDGSSDEVRDPNYGTCSAWTSTSVYGTTGVSGATNWNWIWKSGKLSCSNSIPVLCACQ